MMGVNAYRHTSVLLRRLGGDSIANHEPEQIIREILAPSFGFSANFDFIYGALAFALIASIAWSEKLRQRMIENPATFTLLLASLVFCAPLCSIEARAGAHVALYYPQYDATIQELVYWTVRLQPIVMGLIFGVPCIGWIFFAWRGKTQNSLAAP